jgi:hypothetical protein
VLKTVRGERLMTLTSHFSLFSAMLSCYHFVNTLLTQGSAVYSAECQYSQV